MRKELKEMVKHLLPEPDCNDEEVVESYATTFEDIFKERIQSLIDKYEKEVKSLENGSPFCESNTYRKGNKYDKVKSTRIQERIKFINDLKQLL